jgi:competence protein ComEC
MSVAPHVDPVRPSISPLIWLAAVAWVSSCAGTEAALRCWIDGGSRLTLLTCGALAVAALLLAIVRSRTVRAIGFVCLIVFGASFVHVGSLAGRAASLESAGVAAWQGTVAADPLKSPFGTSVKVRLDSAPAGPVAVVSWPEKEQPPAYGRRVVLDGRLRARLRAEASADSFRRGEVLLLRPWRVTIGEWAAPPLGWVAGWRASVIATLTRLGGAGPESLACMLFSAPPSPAAAQVIEDARTAGVAWAVTTSGLHLAAIVAMVGALSGVLGCGRRGRAVATLLALGAAVLVTGLRLSLIRAAIAAAAATLARVAGRRRDAMASLGATVLLLVAVDPAAAYDLGLLLGAVALTAIAAYGALMAAWVRPLVGRTASRLLGTSIAAQVAVAPISAACFGGASLAGPLVLAVTGAPVAGAAAVALLGSVLLPLSPGAAEAVLRLAGAVVAASAHVWATVARVPLAFVATPEVPWWVWPGWIAVASVVWARWPRPRRAARVRAGAFVVALALAVAVFGAVPVGPRIGVLTVLDVGQGDAILVRDGSHALLVDTGPDPLVLRRALARAGVHSLDGLVLTHAHADHVGGISGLAGVARPGWIGVPDVVDTAVDRLTQDCASRTDSVVRLRRDVAWTVGATKVRVLWPAGGERRLDANDTSVVLLVERQGVRALLLGDAEEQAQRGVLEVWRTAVDMLKVAHHGSPNGNVPAVLEAWAPRLALISVGTGNRFGHPSSVALSSLAAVGAEVHRTDLEGDLVWDVAAVAEPAASSTAPVRVPLCDNPSTKRGMPRWPDPTFETAFAWLLENSTISSPSTSSTAPRSCFSSAPREGFAIGWQPWLTSTSTWRRSGETRPPPMRSSTRPTLCRS